MVGRNSNLYNTMSDVKTFMFPDSGTRSGGLDPNALLAMMNNGGGFGANGNWIWVIFLFFLYGWNRNCSVVTAVVL